MLTHVNPSLFDYEKIFSCHPIRKKLAINNSFDLILAGENGDNLFASSRSRNQFFEGRELWLNCTLFTHWFFLFLLHVHAYSHICLNLLSSGFLSEVVNGELVQSLAQFLVVLVSPKKLGTVLQNHAFAPWHLGSTWCMFEKSDVSKNRCPKTSSTKEADEVLAHSEGRWMSFSITNETMVVLQPAGLPDHLKKLETDTPITLQSLIMDLQDAGEVT